MRAIDIVDITDKIKYKLLEIKNREFAEKCKLSALAANATPMMLAKATQLLEDRLSGCYMGDNYSNIYTSFNYKKNEPTIVIDYSYRHAPYDVLMSLPESYISIDGDDKEITAALTCRYGWAEAKVTIGCDLPEDDFETLVSIGKIEEEYVESSVEYSVLCRL